MFLRLKNTLLKFHCYKESELNKEVKIIHKIDEVFGFLQILIRVGDDGRNLTKRVIRKRRALYARYAQKEGGGGRGATFDISSSTLFTIVSPSSL